MEQRESRSILQLVQNVRRKELPLALLMFCYFFLVISTFWVLKPIKKSLLVSFYKTRPFELFGSVLSGPQAELIAKVLNMVVAYLAVVVFTLLARRLRRQSLSLVFCAFFAVSLVAYALLLSVPNAGVVWSFYLFGDLYSTVMVATFFVFLNDSFVPEAARRVYGLIVLGGVAGGVFGSVSLRGMMDRLTHSQWMGVCMGATLVVAALAIAAGRIVDRASPKQTTEPDPPAQDRPGNPALEGAKLALRSRYLLSIVGIVGLYEVVSTVMDFQFTATLDHYDKLGQIVFGEQIATAYAITNTTTLVVQIFLTGWIMTRFRLTVALLMLPAAALTGSAVFLALPLLWPGTLLNTIDNSLSYSVNQSSKEALYTVATREEKYQAKAFIDMFVQRFAKAVAVGVSLGITVVFTHFSAIRWLSLFTAIVIVAWIFAARHAGRRFHQLADTRPPQPGDESS